MCGAHTQLPYQLTPHPYTLPHLTLDFPPAHRPSLAGLLEDDLEVYATTAANARESSWGTYCPGMNPSPPPEFVTCLGDLYRWAASPALLRARKPLQSLDQAADDQCPAPRPVLDHAALPLWPCSVAWLENSDRADLTRETLKKQFQLVKARTSNNFT